MSTEKISKNVSKNNNKVVKRSKEDNMLFKIGRQVRRYIKINKLDITKVCHVDFFGIFAGQLYAFRVYRCGRIAYRKPGTKEYIFIEEYDDNKIPNMHLSDNSRYYKIKINGVDISVHRLIMACFDEDFARNPEKYVVNHTVTRKDFSFRYGRDAAHIDVTGNNFLYLEKIVRSKAINPNTEKFNQTHGGFVDSYCLDGVMVKSVDLGDLENIPDMMLKTNIYSSKVPYGYQQTMDTVCICINSNIESDDFIYHHTKICDKVQHCDALNFSDKSRYINVINDIHNIYEFYVNRNRDLVEAYYKSKGITYQVRF